MTENKKKSQGSERLYFRYRRLWLMGTISSMLVALVPLGIMFVTNYFQYKKAFQEEIIFPILQLASNNRRSLEFFLEERRSALNFIIHDYNPEQLGDQKKLTEIFKNMTNNYEGFVDIGLIGSSGVQKTYIGPYGLRGKNYKEQDWFQETLMRGLYISNVFMGYRQIPHFVIAVKNEDDKGNAYILRATLNATIFDRVIHSSELRARRDAFIINREGILQTPSKHFGQTLGKMSFPVPKETSEARIIQMKGEYGYHAILGVAHIDNSSFVYIVMEETDSLLTSWFSLRKQLIWFLVISVLLIVIVIITGSTYMVNRIREADTKRVAMLHGVEYTAKMASIGRLAAGVAHEINNPLAIINEKAGLVKDIISLKPERTQEDEKYIKQIDQILKSVERCSRITRRLLGFAKHMDVQKETINIEVLLKEVLSFLEKESDYRSIKVSFKIEKDIPLIQSDPGQLQQVFLNIINNAFAAVEDGGRVDITVACKTGNNIKVSIQDNGVGIIKEHLDKIFDPFFTTKEKYGTGLGLSITYGIVEKLGGEISADSEPGAWTRFDVVLPIDLDSMKAQGVRNEDSIGG